MKICVKEQERKINANIFGIFLEDINYALDGGLYAELLENRNFEFHKTTGYFGNYTTTWDGGYGWEAVNGVTNEMISFDTSTPLVESAPHSMKLKTKKANQGVVNKAYEGITLKKGEEYKFRMFAKTQQDSCDVYVQLCDDTMHKIQVEEFQIQGHDWKEYTAVIKASASITKSKFCLILPMTGEIEIAFVSLMPISAVAGVFRKDLFEVLSELQPGFLRFPGGCIVEGSTLSNRYQWKESLGVDYARKNNWNRWAVHEAKEELGYMTEFAHYNQSLGIGFYEYFLLCDLLHAKPVPIVNVGLACQFHTDEKVDVRSEEFDTYIQDALDLIEFANGDANTTWGKKRIEMGHKEPFHMEYLGVGNEQWETEQVDYYKRYEIFEKKIHEKYPDMKLVGSVGPDVISEKYESAWNFFRKASTENANFTSMIDEHYYLPPTWFLEHTDFYDSYPRTIDIFAGEYAAHTDEKENNWESALSEAAFMTGLVKNADVIKMAAYAPLFARRNFTQWKPDLIWFDDECCVKTPNYYVQQLFSKYTGNILCDLQIDEMPEGVFVEATKTDTSQVFVKIVNTTSQEISLKIQLDGSKTKNVLVLTLQNANLASKNEFDMPQQIQLKQESLPEQEVYAIEPYALKVYLFE